MKRINTHPALYHQAMAVAFNQSMLAIRKQQLATLPAVQYKASYNRLDINQTSSSSFEKATTYAKNHLNFSHELTVYIVFTTVTNETVNDFSAFLSSLEQYQDHGKKVHVEIVDYDLQTDLREIVDECSTHYHVDLEMIPELV